MPQHVTRIIERSSGLQQPRRFFGIGFQPVRKNAQRNPTAAVRITIGVEQRPDRLSQRRFGEDERHAANPLHGLPENFQMRIREKNPAIEGMHLLIDVIRRKQPFRRESPLSGNDERPVVTNRIHRGIRTTSGF